jgi:hypothetical protein
MTILERLERHMERAQIPPARLGRELVGDPRFIFDLRLGRRPRAETLRRVRHWLSAHQDAGR